MIKSRFCPSPTGLLHLGNIRTALFNKLFAKAENGVFLLRIEDSDQIRSAKEYTEALQHDLQWLALSWEEGPLIGGNNGPYLQSERQAVYQDHYQVLQKQGLAYPCFCTEKQLMLNRKVQLAAGQPPRYPGTCRALTAQEVKEKLAEGLKATLRFKVEAGKEIIFEDLLRGQQVFRREDIGDFIIRRADGSASFMFCNAIDDASMGVSHVIRGEDHLTNTPRQIMLLEQLNLPIPHYVHISLIIAKDRTPLSKRNGSLSVQELRESGYLPIAVVNYLARLGHYYSEDVLMDLNALAKQFSLKQLNRSPAKFDPGQLRHWQKIAVMKLTAEAFEEWIGATVWTLVPKAQRADFIDMMRANIEFPKEVLQWTETLFAEVIEYDDTAQDLLKKVGSRFLEVTVDAVNRYEVDFSKICQHIKEKHGVQGKELFQPLRVALTGKLHGPELAKILTLMGKQKVLQRIEIAHKTIEGLC